LYTDPMAIQFLSSLAQLDQYALQETNDSRNSEFNTAGFIAFNGRDVC
jgi:hypothetical protein